MLKPVAVQKAPAPQPAVPSVEGLDGEAGLKRTRGNRDLYLSLLKQFVTGFAAFEAELTLYLREGKYEEAERHAHSLKGVAANIGATTIAEKAGALEQILRRRESPERAVAEVERELGPMIASLAEHLGIEATLAMPSIDTSPLEHDLSNVSMPEWVDELRRLLADGDVAAQQLWSERGEELKAVLPVKIFTQVRRAVENFEFDVALATLSTEKAGT